MITTQNKLRITTMTWMLALVLFSTVQAQDDLSRVDDEGIQDKKTMPVQLSFVYPLGTNGLQSYEVINNVSLNMLAGISGGVHGVELGGLANVTRGNVIGYQSAGLVNSSFGYLEGTQFAGLVNFNRGTAIGGQLAGLINVNLDSLTGIQMAGLVNTNIKDVRGIQAAGLVNATVGSVDGIQMSGIANVVTDEIKGAQLGLINFAKTLNGFQLGLINVADSVGKGGGLGLITFYRNGYHAVQVEFNETFQAGLSIKSGVDKFYMIYSVGFKSVDNRAYWAPGIGFGTNMRISDKMTLSADLLSQHVNEDKWWSESLNMLNSFKLNASYRFFDKFEVYGGPSFNVVVSEIKDDEGNIVGDSFSPWSFYDKTNSNNRVKMYIGLNAGIRF